MAENVAYDYASLNSHTHTRTDNGIAYGPISGANGAYNAIIYGTSVCEGYTRAMQYLLKLKNIKTRNVYCFATQEDLGLASSQIDEYFTPVLPKEGSHSIICIDDYNSLYCDPCWDACTYQKGFKSLPYTLLNKNEMSKDHALAFSEAIVNNSHISIARSTIASELERIETKEGPRK